jgi:hypothetical protein
MAFCTKCGRPIEQQAKFCKDCGAAVRGVTVRNQDVVRAASAPTVLPRPQVIVIQSGIKSSGLAAVLSFFWCGLGQVYLGQIGTGVALMLGYPVMLFFGSVFAFGGALFQTGGTFLLGLIFLLMALVMWIFGMVNAYHTAERANQQDFTRF